MSHAAFLRLILCQMQEKLAKCEEKNLHILKYISEKNVSKFLHLASQRYERSQNDTVFTMSINFSSLLSHLCVRIWGFVRKSLAQKSAELHCCYC